MHRLPVEMAWFRPAERVVAKARRRPVGLYVCRMWAKPAATLPWRGSGAVATFRGSPMTSHRYPETHVFYRKLGRQYPRIVRGDGCYLYDDQGRRYLDGSGGAYVVNVGHGVSEIAEALACQAGTLAYVSGT